MEPSRESIAEAMALIPNVHEGADIIKKVAKALDKAFDEGMEAQRLYDRLAILRRTIIEERQA